MGCRSKFGQPFILSEGLLEWMISHANIPQSIDTWAPVAQRIEHLPSKQRAAGSSPAGGTRQRFLAEPFAVIRRQIDFGELDQRCETQT